jgi:hypothetical protein
MLKRPAQLAKEGSKENQSIQLESQGRRRFLKSLSVSSLATSAYLLLRPSEPLIRKAEAQSDQPTRDLIGHLIVFDSAAQSTYSALVYEELPSGTLIYSGLVITDTPSTAVEMIVEKDQIEFIESQPINVPGTTTIEIEPGRLADIEINLNPFNVKRFEGVLTTQDTGKTLTYIYQDLASPALPQVAIIGGGIAVLCRLLLLAEAILCHKSAADVCAERGLLSVHFESKSGLLGGCEGKCVITCDP